jgi:hypothetical protein
MNFKKKGWFLKYVEFRKKNPFDSELPTSGIAVSDDSEGHTDIEQAIYGFLQPTGIMYGMPVNLPFDDQDYPNRKYFDKSDIARLVFLESLYACLLADARYHSNEELDSVYFEKVVQPSIEYFLESQGEKIEHGKIKQDELYQSFEKLLKKRIHLGNKNLSLSSYFANSLLFLDLIFTVEWFREQQILNRPVSGADYRQRLKDMHVLLLKLIIAASHSSESIEREEIRLFRQFIVSTDLSKSESAEFKKAFKKGISLSDIEIPQMQWLEKRYFLELCVLTVMSDSVVTDEEYAFLEALTEKLQLSTEDLDQSHLALESFLLNHEKDFKSIRDKHAIQRITGKMQDRVSKLMIKNKDRLLKEIEESKELYQLLIKARSEPLTPEEKEKVRIQLLDILKTIPPIVIIALPGTFMTLPVLLKIIPNGMLPSAFQED